MEDIIFTSEFLSVVVSVIVLVVLIVSGVKLEEVKVREWILNIINTFRNNNA